MCSIIWDPWVQIWRQETQDCEQITNSFNNILTFLCRNIWELQYIMIKTWNSKYTWYIHLIFTWYIHLIYTHGIYTWYIHLIYTPDIYTWYIHMVYTHGIYTWYIHMVYIHDIYTFPKQTGFAMCKYSTTFSKRLFSITVKSIRLELSPKCMFHHISH